MHGDTATADPVSVDVIGILDTIDVPVVVVGRDCKVARFNRAAAETLGATPIGRRPADLRHASADGCPGYRQKVHAGDGRWSAVAL